MDVKQINKEYGDKMLEALTIQKAAVVFMIGLDRQGNPKTVMTTDMRPHQYKAGLKRAIEILQNEFNKIRE